MFPLRILLLATAIAALCGALLGAKLAADYKQALCTNQINLMQIESERAINTQQAKVLEHEQALTALRTQLEKDHAAAQARVDRTLEENRRLVRLAGGLRDPGKPKACVAVPAAAEPAGHGDHAASGGVLSGEAEEFLLEFAADADRVVEQYRACQAWAVSLAETNHGP